jgi:hypothetical protein
MTIQVLNFVGRWRHCSLEAPTVLTPAKHPMVAMEQEAEWGNDVI